MRRLALILAVFCLSLSGCGQPVPARAADGLSWSGEWISVGNVLGVDTPDGLEPRENNDALSANGMYYATWSIGAAQPYTNEDGNEAELYDAQLYLLLAGYSAAEKAEAAAAEWLEMAGEKYSVEETASATYNGQTFTVITYTFQSETNPYAYGVSAFGVYRNYAVSAELSCRESFSGDAGAVLAEFLENCHYAV